MDSRDKTCSEPVRRPVEASNTAGDKDAAISILTSALLDLILRRSSEDWGFARTKGGVREKGAKSLESP